MNTIHVLNTRPETQAGELSELLTRNGYWPVEVPLVELILIPEGLTKLSKVSPDEYDGVLLSSPSLLPLLTAIKAPILRSLVTKDWYLISNQARAQVEALGAKVAFVPKKASLDGFYHEFPLQSGLRVLHLCSRITRLDPKLFEARGILVRNFAMYAPHCPTGAAFALRSAWPKVQAALFASGSAVHNLFSVEPELGATIGTAKGPKAFSIGASATEALHANGIEEFRQALTADNAGLISALNTEFHDDSSEEEQK